MKKVVISILVLLAAAAFFAHSGTAYADCQGPGGITTGTAGNESFNCTGGDDPNGVNTGTGNDTVTTDNMGGNITYPALDGHGVVAFGTLTLEGDGNIFGGYDGINASGNVTNNGSGDIAGTNYGIIAGGNVTNNGSGNISGEIYGIAATNITNTGNGTVTGTGAGGIGIYAFGGNNAVTISNGTIGGTANAVYTDSGNDTVTITVGVVTLNANVNGGVGFHDIFHLTGSATQGEINMANDAATICNATATGDDCHGTLSFGGKSYEFVNFEELVVLLTLIVNEEIPAGGAGGADVPAQSGAVAICDGSVKVFRQANGDLDVYSGFDALPPNGFMVGRITAGELATGIRRFQDIGTAAQLGWVVEVTLSDKLIIQVFDGQGNPVGTCPL